MLRDVPFSTMHWYSYEKTKAWLRDRAQSEEASMAFVSGALSGSIAAVASSPLLQRYYYYLLFIILLYYA